MDPISRSDYDNFREFLKDACGIVLGENKHYLVNSRLRTLLRDANIGGISDLLAQLKTERNGALRNRIVDAMTTNETYWFRDTSPFAMLTENLLPTLTKDGSRVRIWSAASSTGQEPYSISMACDEYITISRRNATVEILGTDISGTVLATAREGLYDELSLSRGLSPERRARYFIQEKNKWRVQQKIKDRVRFQELNLIKNFSSLGKFDIVFCRYVLIYFSAEQKADIIGRIATVLKPGGYLFLGGSEAMGGAFDLFETVRYQNGLIFKLKNT